MSNLRTVDSLPNFSDVTIKFVSAGNFWADGGGALGVLPKPLWEKQIAVDKKNRIELALNCLYIETPSHKIVVDTGIGNIISKRVNKIYSPSPFTLLENLNSLNINRQDIDFVVLSHLHFDHAGGIFSIIDNEKALTFPNAKHLIQSKEWEKAKFPDKLNKAAYNFQEHLSLLEKMDNLKLIDGDFAIDDFISLLLVGGHSAGMQIVKIKTGNKNIFYPADIIPTQFHLFTAITSAYDVCRHKTAIAKEMILSDVEKNNGFIIFNHDPLFAGAESI